MGIIVSDSVAHPVRRASPTTHAGIADYHHVIASLLLKQAGLKRSQAHTGAVTLIQRFGSAANLNIHLHCLVLDGVYRTCEGGSVFQEARFAPSVEELQALLVKITTRIMRLLTHQGLLIEEQGMSYLAEPDSNRALTPLQAASCTYRIAPGPPAGQKVLSLTKPAGYRQVIDVRAVRQLSRLQPARGGPL
jgi:hypothetical protein